MKHTMLGRLTLVVAIFSVLAIGVSAQDKMSGKMDDKMMGDKMGKMDNMMGHAKTTVAIIRADWCSACQKIEPTLAQLKEQYKGRINFVVLDVTTDESTRAATATARKHGLAKFFAANKKKTSTVVVLDSKHKILFKTDHNDNREAYVRAFDSAIARG
ncbi:MAG: redoxin domain-containing protein [Acidobacteria bacterium]|nr:redoxin domain-containing protein [Acidobacteriota bacterium]